MEPGFRSAVESPNPTIETFINNCRPVTAQFPPSTRSSIYLRVYTRLDQGKADVNNAGIYVGQSVNVRVRGVQHDAEIEKRKGLVANGQPERDLPTHYDIAAKCDPNDVHILLAVCGEIHLDPAFRDTNSGLSVALDIMEQTVMLALRTYPVWVSTARVGEDMTTRLTQARLLHSVSEPIRSRLGLLEHFRPTYGTNVNSPIFMSNRAGAKVSAREIQAVHTPGARPWMPGMTVYRLPVFFFIPVIGRPVIALSIKKESWRLRRRVLTIRLHSSLVAKILDTIDPVYKASNGFSLTLVFQLMDDREPHAQPCVGVPEFGMFKDAAKDVHSLGLRVEWKLAGLNNICTAPIPLYTRLTVQMNKQLVRAGGEAGVPRAERMFQEILALINMLRYQTFSDPSPGTGWDITVHPGYCPPMVRLLQVDHLRQTLDWKVLEHTRVPVPEEATFEENTAKLRAAVYAGRLTPLTTLGYPAGGTKDRMYFVDGRSAQAVGRTGVMCDTCSLLTLVIAHMHHVECSATPGTTTCQACTRLRRPCTFTARAPLVQGWTGDRSQGRLTNLEITKGPMKHLIFFRTISPKCTLDGAKIVPAPLGWDLMTALHRADEDDGEDEVQDKQKDGEVAEGEYDDESEEYEEDEDDEDDE